MPIVDAAIAMLPPPADLTCELTIRCAVPAGASTGTSAAVTVALVGALARLRGHDLTPGEAAELAYDVETEHLGRQSGVQDQIAAAFGGINAITIAAFPERLAFPSVTVTPLDLAAPVRAALEQRLILVYLGQGHESSAIHEAVIQALADAGPEAPPLVRLRQAALDATDALQAGDLGRFGAALQHNTDAQADLHPMLVSDQARRLMAVAREHGAIGWKVNGAGGDGGTLTLLGGERTADRDATDRRPRGERSPHPADPDRPRSSRPARPRGARGARWGEQGLAD